MITDNGIELEQVGHGDIGAPGPEECRQQEVVNDEDTGVSAPEGHAQYKDWESTPHGIKLPDDFDEQVAPMVESFLGIGERVRQAHECNEAETRDNKQSKENAIAAVRAMPADRRFDVVPYLCASKDNATARALFFDQGGLERWCTMQSGDGDQCGKVMLDILRSEIMSLHLTSKAIDVELFGNLDDDSVAARIEQSLPAKREVLKLLIELVQINFTLQNPGPLGSVVARAQFQQILVGDRQEQAKEHVNEDGVDDT